MLPITILLVDDQPLFREGLRMVLSTQPDLKVVGEAANGMEALELAAQLQPQLVLMDLRMPVLDGVAATYKLHAMLPECRVLALTTFADHDTAACLEAGAVGWLLKDAPTSKLLAAIRQAAEAPVPAAY